LQRAGELSADAVTAVLRDLESAPVALHRLADLLAGAKRTRDRLRLVGAPYVELSENIRARLPTTDAGLARASAMAELLSA
jgi:predicted nucleic acid-binding protein